jgi:hypothetical protein
MTNSLTISEFRTKTRALSVLLFLPALIASTVCLGQEDNISGTRDGQESTSEGELAKKTQNPVADLISVPIQNNFNFNIGPYNQTQSVFNIQPVVPIKLNDDFNLITRTILPVVDQPDPVSNTSQFGLGNLNTTLFLSPSKSKAVTWGVGPILSFPTKTNDLLGSNTFTIGPSAVVVGMPKDWVIGVLANQQWSIGDAAPNQRVNAMLIQPFINYNLPKGWYLTSSPIITANWEASGSQSSNRWVIPVGAGFGKIVKTGGPPLNVNLQGFYNVVSPNQGPDWQLRFQVALLFPK